MKTLLFVSLFLFSCAFFKKDRVEVACPYPLEVAKKSFKTDREGFTYIRLKIKNNSKKAVEVMARVFIETDDGLIISIPGFEFSLFKVPPRKEVTETYKLPYMLREGEKIKIKCLKVGSLKSP